MYKKKTPRLPLEPHFHIQPIALLQAVDDLPLTKGIEKKGRQVLDKVRQQILDVSEEKFEKSKNEAANARKTPTTGS